MRISVQQGSDVCMAGNSLDSFVICGFSDSISEEAVPMNVGGSSVQIDCFVDALHHIPM